jgi:TolA-binding protein
LKAKLGLMAVLVILSSSIVVNAYFYAAQQRDLAVNSDLQAQAASIEVQLANLSSQISGFQSEKTSLETQLASIESQLENLHNQINSLENDNSNLQNENANIQSQINHGGTPKIVTRIGATDVRQSPATGHPWSGQIRLYLSGEVWNVGSGIARNVRLHVTLYQGDAVANETYIELDTINAGSWADAASNIYYVGDALTNWTIIPEQD